MTTEDFSSELFYRVDEAMKEVPKPPLANLWPSEIVTLGVLFALKGVGTRAFYRWVSRDWRGLFPALPERTRLFRLFATHRSWTEEFLAAPSVWGWSLALGLSCSTPCAQDAVPSKSAVKGNPIIAGLSGASSVCCSLTWAWW